eukprot:2785969-Pleurochrysis_carterae.AAC.2
MASPAIAHRSRPSARWPGRLGRHRVRYTGAKGPPTGDPQSPGLVGWKRCVALTVPGWAAAASRPPLDATRHARYAAGRRTGGSRCERQRGEIPTPLELYRHQG